MVNELRAKTKRGNMEQEQTKHDNLPMDPTPFPLAVVSPRRHIMPSLVHALTIDNHNTPNAINQH